MNGIENNHKNKPGITKNPIIIFLAGIVGAFVTGVTGWIFLEEKVNAQVDTHFNQRSSDFDQKIEGLSTKLSDVEKLKNSSAPHTNALPIGSILSSVLPPDDFSRVYGNDWILADGRNVATSTQYFKITGEREIPDLRGLFLRGINAGRTDDKRDPDGDGRKPGDYQVDEFKRHDHQFEYLNVSGSPPPNNSVAGGGGYLRKVVTQRTQPTGGSETRPKNAAVYYYIKVD